MRYLQSPDYEHAFEDDALTVYTKKSMGPAVGTSPVWLEEIRKMLEQPATKATAAGLYSSEPAILKVNTLRYLSQKVRARFGIQRHGRYEWATAELHTAIKMQGKPYIPELYAYGWTTEKLGLPSRTFSVTQNLTNTITLEEFATRHPTSKESALILAFDTLLTALRDRLLHLDPWAGNFLITEDLCRCWLIDLEFSKLNSSASIEQQLGFSFGFFFRGKFSAHLEKETYLAFIKQWAQERAAVPDIPSLMAHTEFYIENKLKRKKRFSAF